jgi:hypothetical protein
MVRYFFDILDNGDKTVDHIGVDLAGLSEARTQATLALTEMAHDYLPADGAERSFLIQVRTADGPLFDVSLDFEMTDTNEPASGSAPI